MFLAVLDFCYGYSLWAAPAPQRQLDLFLPWQGWAVAWLVTGAVCLAGVPAVRDWWAFTAATLLKAAWAAVMADTWLEQGIPRGWVSAVIWGVFALTVLVVSSWPDAPPRP
jgi:hypothetical protein